MKKKTTRIRKTKKKKPLNLASIQATLDNAEKMCKELHLPTFSSEFPNRENELLGRGKKRIRRIGAILVSRSSL